MKENTIPATQDELTPAKHEETRETTMRIVPPVDIFEYEDGLAVVVDLPGVSKENATVRVEDQILSIEAEADYRPPGTSLHREFELGHYFRQFELSERVDQNKIQAEMKHGVLTLRLPRTEESKPKKIEIAVA